MSLKKLEQQNITGVHSEAKKKESRLKIKRSVIAVEDKPANINVDVDIFEKRLQKFPLSVAPYFSTAVIDPALSPNILKQTGYEDVTSAKWSPVGCDRTGRYL